MKFLNFDQIQVNSISKIQTKTKFTRRKSERVYYIDINIKKEKGS